jgi:hypothetical protein
MPSTRRPILRYPPTEESTEPGLPDGQRKPPGTARQSVPVEGKRGPNEAHPRYDTFDLKGDVDTSSPREADHEETVLSLVARQKVLQTLGHR